VDFDQGRFTAYLMNPDHPHNRGKAEGWQRIGYDVSTDAAREESSADVIRQLRRKLSDSPIVRTDDSPYGHRLNTETPFTGPNDQEATSMTWCGWSAMLLPGGER
jgi:hypothetical protein